MAPSNKTKPKARTTKMTTQTLLDFDLEESSSDSDFRIEDHDESDDDCSENSNAVESGGDDDEDDDTGSGDESDTDFSDFKAKLLGSSSKEKDTEVKDVKTVLAQAVSSSMKEKLPTNPICCACLGDRSDDTNEIVECDGCGVSVHEGCYGVSDSGSVSSTTSSCSTEPWFCEACKANVTNPACELCPNRGGIFKETDVGKWVHLVCALYVPGVAFGEVDQLSSVTLFEMPYSKWGAKTCSLCEDARFARTGVCIGCDAGMCKTYFHVTCAQAAGFLSEAHSEEADHADPFYAHCKVHSDKSMIKHRKRNFNTLKLRMEQRKLTQIENQYEKPTDEQLRIQRKLNKHQIKYRSMKTIKTEPWVPTQKMPRLLTTSATACRRLILKAELMGIDTAALEFQEAQMAALADVRKKWHIPPAFSVEFIGYYLDRISRLKDLKSNLERHIEMNKKLLDEQQNLRDEYDKKMKVNSEVISKNTSLKDEIADLHKQIQVLCPNKNLSSLDNIGRQVAAVNNQPSAPPARPMSVPTAAALKMGVGFPLVNLPGTKDDTGRILSTQRQNSDDLVHECGICKRCNDQHLLAKCDTCHFYYHLGCLNPPLTRHPKKSKLYGWQCSECDKSDDSDVAINLPKGPRKSRTRFSKDGTIVPVEANVSANTDENTSTKSSDITTPSKRKSIDSSPKKEKSVSIGKDVVEVVAVNGNLEQANSIPIATSAMDTKIISKDIKKIKSTSLPKKIKDDNDKTKPAIIKNTDNSTTSQKTSKTKNTSIKNDDNKKVEDNAGKQPVSGNMECNISKQQVVTKSEKKIKKDSKSMNNDESIRNESQNKDIQKAASATTTTTTTTAKDSITDKSNLSISEHITKNSSGINAIDQNHKQNRKRRKEKHKNKYSSDNEKSPSKEHKRKRKKKNHDMENPNDSLPKIKIKFKTLPLPGEAAPEPHFFYVSAAMVRPLDTSRPTSVETIDDSTMNADDFLQNTSPIQSTIQPTASTPSSRIPTPSKASTPAHTGRTPTKAASPTKTPTVGRTASPRKLSKRESTSGNNSAAESRNSMEMSCDVCHLSGTAQNLVKCDECEKIYHFTCLDPPLKKTPKRRGYSWHCADCDPTDNESLP